MKNYYNQTVLYWMKKITKCDIIPVSARPTFKVEDGLNSIEFLLNDKSIAFKVYGNAYLIAMVKWLQNFLKKKRNIEEIEISRIKKEFELPENKIMDAILLIRLVEIIKKIISFRCKSF